MNAVKPCTGCAPRKSQHEVTWGSSDTVVAMHIKVEVKQLVASTARTGGLAKWKGLGPEFKIR